MSRTSRNNMENSSFLHIMVQGINKEYIFNQPKDKSEYLKLIYSKNRNIHILAYCIMDNHAHVLVQSNNIQHIQVWMKKVNTSYAIYYNRKNDRVGYVFRERYKTQPIKNEKHLYLGLEYIHNNPVKAGICNQKEEYEFSSYSKIYQGNPIKIQEEMQPLLKSVICPVKWDEKMQSEKFELIEEEKESKEKLCQEIIQNFLQNRQLKIDQLKKEKQMLTEIVKILKWENNISYRMMEKHLEISREKLRKLIIERI